MSKCILSKQEKRQIKVTRQLLREGLLQLRTDFLASGHTAAEWNDVCETIIARHKPLNVDLIKGMKIWNWRQAMDKIIEVLLYPFTELAGWMVMRGLRRWAKGYRAESPAEIIR